VLLLRVPPVVPLRIGPGVGVRVLMCGGLLVLLLVCGELYLPLLVRGRLPVLVGFQPLMLLRHLVDIGLILVGLFLLVMMPVLQLLVGR
jgi:hypothetical protein